MEMQKWKGLCRRIGRNQINYRKASDKKVLEAIDECSKQYSKALKNLAK